MEFQAKYFQINRASLMASSIAPMIYPNLPSYLVNRGSLADLLSITPQELKILSCDALILQAYIKWGDQCTTYLAGDFSFVIYDYEKQRIFCARDQMGIQP